MSYFISHILFCILVIFLFFILFFLLFFLFFFLLLLSVSAMVCSICCALFLFNSGRSACVIDVLSLFIRWHGCSVNVASWNTCHAVSSLKVIAVSFTCSVLCSKSNSYFKVFKMCILLILIIIYKTFSCKMPAQEIMLMVKNCMTDTLLEWVTTIYNVWKIHLNVCM